jgi:excisionase family DNA binding protein
VDEHQTERGNVKQTEVPESRQWLTYCEAQTVSGLGRTTLWTLISAGEVEAARVGRAVRINRKSLENYLRRNSYAQGI